MRSRKFPKWRWQGKEQGRLRRKTAYSCLILLVHVLNLTNSLRHRTHRAEGAPASRLVEGHHNQTNDRRREHQAVEAVGELSDPDVRFREQIRRVRPFPRNLKRPEQRYRLFERMYAGRDKVRLDYNACEHR